MGVRMNGKPSTRKTIVPRVKAMALAIDYTTDKLFYIVNDQIMSCDFDGNNQTMILSAELELGETPSLAVFGDYLYWPDRTSRSVYRASKDPSSEILIEKLPFNDGDYLNGLKDIKIFHSDAQPQVPDSPCGGGGGGCSHLCLLGDDRRAECACPDGYVINGTDCQPGLTVRLHGTNVPELYYGDQSGYICDN